MVACIHQQSSKFQCHWIFLGASDTLIEHRQCEPLLTAYSSHCLNIWILEVCTWTSRLKNKWGCLGGGKEYIKSSKQF